MGTIVAIKTSTASIIATDACNLIEPIVGPQFNAPESCLLRCGPAVIGLQSSIVFQQAFETAATALYRKGDVSFTTRGDVQRFFHAIHHFMKQHLGFIPTTQPGQAFENTPMNALVMTPTNLYKVDSGRAVYEFTRFWALGSGEMVALGALEALSQFELPIDEVARRSLATVASFESKPAEIVGLVKLTRETTKTRASKTKARKKSEDLVDEVH